MKVILLQELKGQGGEGDVVDVKRGYAVNFLLPQRIAVEATKGNLKQLELRRHNIAKREAERLDTSDKLLAAVDGKTLVIAARVGEEGQLFGSVTTQRIADKLQEDFGVEIDRKKIDLHAPIKTVGEHQAIISIYRDLKATLTIAVVDEKALAELEEEALQANAALKEVANKLVQAADAADADTDPEAVADAAVRVFRETEIVLDATVAEALAEDRPSD